MQVGLWVWALFAFLVAGMLAVDLLVLRGSRGEGREPTFRSAALWSAAWISLGLLFGFVVRGLYGPHAQLTYAVCDTWVARILPVTPVLHGSRFWVRQGGRLVATPLLIALIVVETTDLVFAIDSIPAAFAVTREPFLVYTSNVFAMLGLRSLYFLLAGAVERFRYLRFGLAGILVFVGVKMLLGDVIDIPIWVSLVVAAGALGIAVMVSVVVPPRPAARAYSR